MLPNGDSDSDTQFQVEVEQQITCGALRCCRCYKSNTRPWRGQKETELRFYRICPETSFRFGWEGKKKMSLIVLSGPLPNCNIHIKTLLKLVKTLQTVTLVNNHVLVSYINNPLFTHNHRQLIRNSVFSFAVFVLSSTSGLSSHCSPL